MPDPDRPSSAPLSEADADRLSERFTASWEDPELASIPVTEPLAPPQPPASPAQPSASATPPAAAPVRPAFGLTAPLRTSAIATPSPGKAAFAAPRPFVPAGHAAPTPGPPAATPPVGKPKTTLLGISPIVVVGPSEPPPASAPAPADKPSSAPAAAPLSAPPPESSSSPTATAVTTPSKPYIPKDHPLTPAVVISGETLAESALPSREDRARIAQTIPGQTRSNPAARAAAPLPVAASSPVLDETYPPLKPRASKLPLVFAGTLLLAAGAFAFTKLAGSGSSEPGENGPVTPPPQTATAAATAMPPAAEAPAPAVPSEPVVAAPKIEAVPAPEAARAPEPPPSKRTKPRKVTAAPARRPAPRPEPKTEAKSTAPAPEPAAAPTTKPAKGVIVRETPF